MKALFDCEVEFVNSPHMLQLYTGFFELQKKGVITLRFYQKNFAKETIGVATVFVNNKYKIVYDTTDGGIWRKGNEGDDLQDIQKSNLINFYFKRSYSKKMLSSAPEDYHIFPLGFNYNIQPEANMLPFIHSLKDKIKYLLKTSRWTRGITGKSFFYVKDFEQVPADLKNTKILFITRLWNPEEAKSEESKLHRQRINAMRVACIEACREKYREQFTGGLIKDAFSVKHYSQLLLPDALTCKKGYLNTIKQHTICIATTGLHNSIGWKMAEYVAASKVIVSEPLHFELPGNYERGKHYLEFANEKELISQIDYLLQNKTAMQQIMQNNHHYYCQYVKPDVLVLNTLNKVAETIHGHAHLQHTTFY